MTPKQIIVHWKEFGPDMDAVSLRNLRDLALVAINDLSGGPMSQQAIEDLAELHAIYTGDLT